MLQETSAPTTDDIPGSRDADRRLVVVSYMANAPFSARGIRTRALLEYLERRWSVELIAGPTDRPGRQHRGAGRFLISRKALRLASSATMLDKFEPWSRFRFRSWRPHTRGALLIGFPFSPLVYASRRLVARGIPYVVDAGDPWVLTADWHDLRALGRLRGRSAEHRLWADAAGGIVTTESQAEALRAVFPDLPLLVRPNGFAPADSSGPTPVARPPSSSRLRLAHFGDLSSDRLNVTAFLQGLSASGVWSDLEFHQYGSDWTGSLRRLGGVRVVFHEPRPWPEILTAASEYDLAVVIGNRDARLLPSKAISYLQLPIPRLAVVGDDRPSALAGYVADKPGWASVRASGPEVAETIRTHLSRAWTASELSPPAHESWDSVAEEICEFLEASLEARGTRISSTVVA